MSSFTKLILIGLTAVSGFATVGAEARSDTPANRQQVLAAHREVASATPVAYHRPYHRRHHGHRVVRRAHR